MSICASHFAVSLRCASEFGEGISHFALLALSFLLSLARLNHLRTSRSSLPAITWLPPIYLICLQFCLVSVLLSFLLMMSLILQETIAG